MKITITIETEKPFCGNEVTEEDYKRWLWSRKNQRYQENIDDEKVPDWLERMQELGKFE